MGRELFVIDYELKHNNLWKKIEGVALNIELTQDHIIWCDFKTGYLVKHNLKNIKKLIIKTVI